MSLRRDREHGVADTDRGMTNHGPQTTTRLSLAELRLHASGAYGDAKVASGGASLGSANIAANAREHSRQWLQTILSASSSARYHNQQAAERRAVAAASSSLRARAARQNEDLTMMGRGTGTSHRRHAFESDEGDDVDDDEDAEDDEVESGGTETSMSSEESFAEEADENDLRMAGEYGRALLDLLEKESRRARILSELLDREQKMNSELLGKQEDISRLRRRATHQQTHLEQLEDQAQELETSLYKQKQAALDEKRRRRALEREIEKLRTLISERDTMRAEAASIADFECERAASDAGTFDESIGCSSEDYEDDPSFVLRHSPSQEVRDELRKRYMNVVSPGASYEEDDAPRHLRGLLERSGDGRGLLPANEEPDDVRVLAQTAALVGQKMTLLASAHYDDSEQSSYVRGPRGGASNEGLFAAQQVHQLQELHHRRREREHREHERQIEELEAADCDASYVSEYFASTSQVPDCGAQEQFDEGDESLLPPDASAYDEVRAMYEDERERRQQLQSEVEALLEECELQRQRAERRRTRGRPSGRNSGLFSLGMDAGGSQENNTMLISNVRGLGPHDAKYTLAVDFAVHRLSSELGYEQSRRATIGKCEIFSAGLSRRRTFVSRRGNQLDRFVRDGDRGLLMDGVATSAADPRLLRPTAVEPLQTVEELEVAPAAPVVPAGPLGPAQRRRPPPLTLPREPRIPACKVPDGRLQLRADGTRKRRIGVGTMVCHGDSHMTYMIQAENNHGGWRMVQTRFSQFGHILTWLREHHEGGLLPAEPMPYPRGNGWFSGGSSTDPQNVRERRNWLEHTLLGVQHAEPALVDVLMDHIGILGARAATP